MDLPVNPPIAPMLAKAVGEIPDGPFSFEPKWDGFRAVVYRDGDKVEIGSRNERPMTRYFPELVAALGPNSRSGASSTARSSSRTARDGGWTSRRCCSASTPPSPGSTCWLSRPPRISSPSTCSPWETGT